MHKSRNKFFPKDRISSWETEIMSVSMVKNRFAFSCRIIVMPLYFKDITVSPTGAKVNGIGGSVIVTLGVL